MDKAASVLKRLQQANVTCDQNLVEEFLQDEVNAELADSELDHLLPKAFTRFLKAREAQEKLRAENASLKKAVSTLEDENDKVGAEKERVLAEVSTLKDKGEFGPFVTRKLPLLVRTEGSSVASIKPQAKHQAARLIPHTNTFRLLPDELLPMDNHIPFIFKALGMIKYQEDDRLKQRPFIPFTNEASVSGTIQILLKEACAWLAQPQLMIEPEYILAGGRPDIVVITGLSGVPVGAIEVKVPNSERSHDQEVPMNSKVLHGQLFDYLLLLRQVFGVEHPLGIETTYHSWRFCWLPESDGFVQEVRQVKPMGDHFHTKISTFSLVGPCEPLELMTAGDKLASVPSLTKADPSFFKDPPPLITGPDRVLHGTPVLSYDHPQLPRSIASFLHKLTYVQVVPQPIAVGPHYPRVGRETFEWAPLPILPRPDAFPLPSTEYLFLLRELGAGQEGKAWLATNSGGATCTVKIFDKGEDVAEATSRRDEERRTWEEIWKIDSVFGLTLLGRPALVMPLLRTAPCFGKLPAGLPAELRKPTLQALQSLDACGHCDDDLNWRHVGFYKDSRGYKAVLLDTQKKPKTETSLVEMQQRLGLA